MKRACGYGCETHVVPLKAPPIDIDAPRTAETQLHRAQRELSESQPRWRRVAGWLAPLVPTTLLAIMPKCPVCFAVYVAIGAGIGLTTQVAAQLRSMLVILCVLSLAYLLARRLRWLVSKLNTHRTAVS